MSSGSDSDEEGPAAEAAAGDVAMDAAAPPARPPSPAVASPPLAPPPAAADAGAAAAQLAAAKSSTSGGGMAIGKDAGRTALSAFLEHLVTKNSGANRSVQEVGLSGEVQCCVTGIDHEKQHV